MRLRLGRVLLVHVDGGAAHRDRGAVRGPRAAPDVRELNPATVAVDGSISDWGALGNSNPNYLADMFQAGKPEKPVLAKAYGQYDCGSGTMYIMVRTQPTWQIVPTAADNYVKLGQNDKQVNGGAGDDGTPRTSRTSLQLIGWEASFQIPPGSYSGATAFNIHAQVIPVLVLTGETAAVENRALDVVIDCSSVPGRHRPRHHSRHRHQRRRRTPTPSPRRRRRRSQPDT